jgi:hypothetical protein
MEQNDPLRKMQTRAYEEALKSVLAEKFFTTKDWLEIITAPDADELMADPRIAHDFEKQIEILDTLTGIQNSIHAPGTVSFGMIQALGAVVRDGQNAAIRGKALDVTRAIAGNPAHEHFRGHVMNVFAGALADSHVENRLEAVRGIETVAVATDYAGKDKITVAEAIRRKIPAHIVASPFLTDAAALLSHAMQDPDRAVRDAASKAMTENLPGLIEATAADKIATLRDIFMQQAGGAPDNDARTRYDAVLSSLKTTWKQGPAP